MSKFGLFEKVVMGVVVAVWATSFFISSVDPSARLGAQAAMMLVLGAIVGLRVTRKDKDE